MMVVWPSGQIQGQESGDPGTQLILGCASACLFPYTLILSSGSVPCMVGFRTLSHSPGAQRAPQWVVSEQSTIEDCLMNVPDYQCVGKPSAVDIDMGSGIVQNWVQILVLETFPTVVQASHITSLSLSLPVCKMGMAIPE